ncbi:MAG: hypothetical protein LUG98_01910 [Tannerellaceae bacterium]|nr:hypothetical protein [Tannerellaceae bacterium]
MKKVFFFLILFSIALQACHKEEDERKDEHEKFITTGVIQEITINNVQGSVMKEISDVVFVARCLIPPGGDYDMTPDQEADRYMVRLPFNTERMSFELPGNPPASLLRTIEKDFPPGFHISDRTAQTISFVTIGWCWRDAYKIQARLAYAKRVDDVYYIADYIYCDKEVNITGSGQDWWGHPLTYDLELKKGWNMVVERREHAGIQSATISNLLPEGMGWFYDRILGGRSQPD